MFQCDMLCDPRFSYDLEPLYFDEDGHYLNKFKIASRLPEGELAEILSTNWWNRGHISERSVYNILCYDSNTFVSQTELHPFNYSSECQDYITGIQDFGYVNVSAKFTSGNCFHSGNQTTYLSYWAENPEDSWAPDSTPMNLFTAPTNLSMRVIFHNISEIPVTVFPCLIPQGIAEFSPYDKSVAKLVGMTNSQQGGVPTILANTWADFGLDSNLTKLSFNQSQYYFNYSILAVANLGLFLEVSEEELFNASSQFNALVNLTNALSGQGVRLMHRTEVTSTNIWCGETEFSITESVSSNNTNIFCSPAYNTGPHLQSDLLLASFNDNVFSPERVCVFNGVLTTTSFISALAQNYSACADENQNISDRAQEWITPVLIAGSFLLVIGAAMLTRSCYNRCCLFRGNKSDGHDLLLNSFGEGGELHRPFY